MEFINCPPWRVLKYLPRVMIGRLVLDDRVGLFLAIAVMFLGGDLVMPTIRGERSNHNMTACMFVSVLELPVIHHMLQN